MAARVGRSKMKRLMEGDAGSTVLEMEDQG